MKILSVVGARPNFMKIAPLARAIRKDKSLKHILVHTGQHYDEAMSKSFFRDLGIPKPTVNLEVGSGSHAQQTALIMQAFEPVLLKYQPDVVVVVGDVNSTLACSVVASKLRIPVVHVEAGLRSFDRNMPEEINRIVTDSISDVMFTTSAEAEKHLVKEGCPKDRIFFAGNVMIDTLMHNLAKAKRSKALEKMKLKKNDFALVTLHRPSNVDHKESFCRIIDAFKEIQKEIRIVFPVHPRTKKNLYHFYSSAQLKQMPNLILTEPLGYLDFLKLMQNAKFIVTDSGGIQDESTVLGVPCLTARENTERPVTVTQGTNTLVGTNKRKIIQEAKKILAGRYKKGRQPKYWDGRSSERIVAKLRELYKKGKLVRK